jgi:hypothetical protein
MKMGQLVKFQLAGENKSAQRKPTLGPFCHPKIPHNLTQAAGAKSLSGSMALVVSSFIQDNRLELCF